MTVPSSKFDDPLTGYHVQMEGFGSAGGPFSSHSGLPLEWRDGQPQPKHDPEDKKAELALKRSLDIVLSTLMILSLLPVLIAIAFAIVFSSRGPVLFVQTREGLLGRPFQIYKFRTVHVDHADPSGLAQVTDGDARATPLGRILRRTSLDELPQLFNILKGDMSLVGPRPHVPGMLAAGRRYDQLVPYYRLRHLAKPGLTGWAQANGLRGATDDSAKAKARIDHDIAYIENFSILLDLRILLLTLSSTIHVVRKDDS